MIGIIDLPFPKKTGSTINHVLHDDCCLEQWIVPKKTEVKLRTSTNFGIVCLPVGTKDKRGFVIPRRLFRW